MKTRVQLSAEELETWLVLHQNELKAAALDEPLISALFATGDRAAFVASFLSRNGINVDLDNCDTRTCLADAARRIII